MKQELQEALRPIISVLDTLDPGDPRAAEILNQRLPVTSEPMQAVADLFARGVAEAWLCDRQGGPGVSYSRVEKCTGAEEFSIDAVRMDRPGPEHTHPRGEFDLCFAVEGQPKFDGNAPGWTAYGPDSHHTPTVEGGTMNILYFLPGGAIHFGPRA